MESEEGRITSFPCTQCGACCKRAWMLGGILPIKENGECEHLTKDNLCGIYESRPDICRINRVYEKYFSSLSIKEYYRRTAKTCNAMMDEDGIDEDLRVTIAGEE